MAKSKTDEPQAYDVTSAPAKIISMCELKNGNVYVATEEKLYQLLDGKLKPLVWADVEHAAVQAGGSTELSRASAVPSAPPPPPPEPETTSEMQ